MEKLRLSSFVLFVEDVLTSKEFYEIVLDQEVQLNIDDINIGFKSGLALWDRNYAIKTIFNNNAISKNETARNSEIYFETSELDAVFDKVQKNRAKILHPVKVQPWQQRVFRIYDPDDNIIEIAETMENVIVRLKNEGMSIDLIAQKTFMPKEIVEVLIKKNEN